MMSLNKVRLFSICSLLFFLSCNLATEINTDIITIVAGTAKITGRIILPDESHKESIMVTVSVTHPISGENVRQEILADQTGKFSLEFDIETETSLIGLYTSVNPYKTLYIKLRNNDSTHIDIVYDSNRDFKNIEIAPEMNKYDMMQSMVILSKMIDYRPDRSYPSLYDKSLDDFLNHAKTVVSERLGIFLDNDTLLSKELKETVSKEFRLFMYTNHVFDYEGQMALNYRNVTGNTTEIPNIQKIDKSFFHFLRDFELNDPQYLQTFTFCEFQNAILQNETLGLPKIENSDIPSWLASVKGILTDFLGFRDGTYYDVLVANAYGRQLNEQGIPLSDKQKEHITNYWQNGEISKILFRKNQQVVELNKVKSPTIVNEISTVPKDKVMETIRAKYKDKVIFIDLWATWCGPCLDAIKQFSSAKGDFQDKDVVFVYLTNGSSPKKLWEEKIIGIGDEHYYLTDEQWEYMMDYFELQAIPSYLLYNRKGILINKFTGFPGNNILKKMINDQLN